MSFINIANELDGMQEEHAVEGGEYKVRITSASVWNNQAFMVRYELTDDPFAKGLSDFINLPSSGRDAKEQNRQKLRLAAFKTAFSLSDDVEVDEQTGQINEWIGAEGWVILKDPTDKGDGYGPQNRITKYIGG